MIGINSNNAGILSVPQSDEYLYFDVRSGERIQQEYLFYTLANVKDWDEIDAHNIDELINKASKEYWIERSSTLLQDSFSGLPEKLVKDIYKHVEENFEKNRVNHSGILDRLLIAPLKNNIDAHKFAEIALSDGNSNVASVFDDLYELQPHIKKYADNWLKIEDDLFKDFTSTKEELWIKVNKETKFSELIQCKNQEIFLKKWNSLAFCFSNPQDRISLKVLGNKIAKNNLPHQSDRDKDLNDLLETNSSRFLEYNDPGLSSPEALENAQKQIDAIVEAVKEGNNRKSEKFLRELIKMQLKFPEGETNAVKSLCNIAQRCANIFRYDFELLCLEKALELPTTDQWTLIQYGDHLKRVGNYDEAIKILDKAIKIGNNKVPKSLKADVYTQKGELLNAIKLYKEIENWEEDPKLQTAIADVYRKMGQLANAQKIYKHLIQSAKKGDPKYIGETEYRATAGLAEVAKQKGDLEKSKELYQKILQSDIQENTDKLFYNLGYCNVLKLNEEYDDAYQIVDKIVQKFPFALEAKFTRGSILGLISREKEGLEDLSKDLTNQWKDWLRNYYKGLLLLKLDRYEDAKESLVEKIPEAISSDEEKYILPLGAALWFISNEDEGQAKEYLTNLPNIKNKQSEYLSLVLNLHIVTKNGEKQKIEKIKKQIAESDIIDKKLIEAISAIDNKDFKIAVEYEIDALLKMAA